MPLLDAKGQPIPPTATKNYAKAPQPIKGEAFAPRWAGDMDKHLFTMPGGGTVMFDLSRLTLADFRTMRDHYQVSACLSALAFMIHQMDWWIECDNVKVRNMVTENITDIWTQLIRAIAQSFWAGYSPNVLQWENVGKFLQLTKIKDLIPEECAVEWGDVEGWAPPGRIPPKIKVFNGIKVWGQNWPVPVENSFWYPILMENGDYYGRKLLRPVFTSWYFSILVHLFSNRYFERFGEPVPVGRASYEDEITVPSEGGPKKVNGANLMVSILQNLRNRSVVVLPNDRSPTGVGTGTEYDYNIEYLESQMRGADFERYLMRLDEEMSLGIFTPLLVLRTADVGSYNLGSTHWNMYNNMLYAICSDAKMFIDSYILSRMVDYNFGKNAPRARIKFRKGGDDRKDSVMAILQALMSGGRVKPDLVELGEIAGLKLEEIEQITAPPEGGTPGSPSQDDQNKRDSGKDTKSSGSSSKRKKIANNSRAVIEGIAARIAPQAIKWGREPVGDGFVPSIGFERKFTDALDLDGCVSPQATLDLIYKYTSMWLGDIPSDVLASQDPILFMRSIQATMELLLDRYIDG